MNPQYSGCIYFHQRTRRGKKLQQFLVLFDVSSIFRNIPLNETIELTLDYILSNNPDVNILRKDL